MALSDGFARLQALFARPWAAPLARSMSELRRPPRPSERVAEAIRESEAVSVLLVAWVQLLGVVMFLALYVASRGAFEGRRGPEPVPLALAGYLLWTVWRLNRAYAGKLTPTLLSIAAAVDVALLMGLIWSFTLQYHAPAALYLKAPTLMYVFILISLRALRFDAGHVLLTGILSALGWLVLVLIAAQTARVTNDYPDYMTSLSLLWGAEAEKLAAILGVTLILALAVSRARALFVKTAVEETAAKDLSRFLDASAARQVRSADTALMAGDGEVKPAAIMFLDLRGFSMASAMLDPKATIALLQDYQRRFVPIIEKAGGSVDKYLGDGILVSFGTGERRGQEAADAFAAVPELVKAADDWAIERKGAGLTHLGVAVAITHGDIVHGVIGYDDRLEFTVIGDAVNLAAKLEKHAKIEHARVIATRDAYDWARGQGAAVGPVRESRGAIVEGVSGPVDLVILA